MATVNADTTTVDLGGPEGHQVDWLTFRPKKRCSAWNEPGIVSRNGCAPMTAP